MAKHLPTSSTDCVIQCKDVFLEQYLTKLFSSKKRANGDVLFNNKVNNMFWFLKGAKCSGQW